MTAITIGKMVQNLVSFLYDIDFKSDSQENINEIVDNLERLGFDEKWNLSDLQSMLVYDGIVDYLKEVYPFFDLDHNKDIACGVMRKIFSAAAVKYFGYSAYQAA